MTEVENADLNALIQWINAFPPEAPPCGVQEISTGFRIWDILRRIDPAFFTGELPESQQACLQWLPRWQNLKYISRSLDRYVNAAGASIPSGIGHNVQDLQSAARWESTMEAEMLKLLKMVMLVALQSPNLSEAVGCMQQIGVQAQSSLMVIIQDLQGANDGEKQQDISEPDQNVGASKASSIRGTDLDLERQVFELENRIERYDLTEREIKKQMLDMEHRINRLQEHNADLQGKLSDAQSRLEESENRRPEDGHVRRLEHRIENQEELIAANENQLGENQQRIESMEKEINRLRKDNARIQPLQDELDEIKIQKDQFAKKANMADKYYQKLQEFSELEKENQLLRGELEEVKHEKGDGKNARSQIIALQRTLEEYKGLLPTIERERFELQMMYKQMERDNDALSQELDTVKDQLTKAQEQVSELRMGRPPSPIEGHAGGLAGEMEDSERRAALDAMPAEERSQKLFKDLDEARSELFMKNQLLEDETKKYTDLKEQYESIHAEKTALERAAQAPSSEAPLSPHPEETIGSAKALDDGAADPQVTTLQAEISKLKERIKTMELQDPALKKMADAALMKQELKGLRQENKLMSTAWYDLNSRVHFNNVILQRKSEQARGILKIGRQLAEKSMAVRAR